MHCCLAIRRRALGARDGEAEVTSRPTWRESAMQHSAGMRLGRLEHEVEQRRVLVGTSDSLASRVSACIGLY